MSPVQSSARSPVRLRKDGVASLLKQVGGRQVKAQDATHSAPQPQLNGEEDFDREPESSEDEEMAAAATQAESAGKIRATTEKGAKQPNGSSRAAPQNPNRSNDNVRRSQRTRLQDEGTYAGRKRKQSGAHIYDAAELVDQWKIWNNPRHSSQTYGSQKAKAARTSNDAESASPTLTPAKSPSGFKKPNVKDSPKRGSQGQHFKFLPTPPSSSPNTGTESNSSLRTFRRPPPSSALSEPSGAQKSNRRSFRTSRLASKESPRSSPSKDTKSTSDQPIDIVSSPPLSPLTDSSSGLSTPPPEAELNDLDLLFAASQTESQRALARCPVCQEYVDKETWELFTRGSRVGWRDKQAFCEGHRRRDAEKLWKDRGYPDINWDSAALKRRMERHSSSLEDVIEGKRHSELLENLKKKVGSGRIRKALRDVNEARSEVIFPGYYGPRGSQVFQAHLLSAFGERLRDMAASGDEVVRATGTGNYIARVLVPELAVKLIAEDLSVEEDQAKKVMEESSEVGRLVNGVEAEEEDVVVVKKEKGV
ncbi:MAG: hypothetical protein Q9162_005022 [Coniocarpon cinnabarinum]